MRQLNSIDQFIRRLTQVVCNTCRFVMFIYKMSDFHKEPNFARNLELSADLQNLRKIAVDLQ